jgi:hypothetical protein
MYQTQNTLGGASEILVTLKHNCNNFNNPSDLGSICIQG